MTKKIQVYVSDSDLKIIDRLLEASGAPSRAAVVKDALGLYDWACEQISNGYSVGAFREGKPNREVVIFRKLVAEREETTTASTGSEAAAVGG